MKDKLIISGFADEISPDFDEQLRVVTGLGMSHISLRSADKKNIADFTLEEARGSLLPRLEKAGVKVSSLGSPIGKVDILDEEGFAKQLAALDTLCQICGLLDCKYIRIFSFFMPEGKAPEEYRDQVLQKMKQFLAVAEKYPAVVLLHENEKDIYGDTAARCRDLFDSLPSPQLKAAFDYANFVQCGEDTAACWELLKDEVAYIHIKDAVYSNNENVVCGSGDGKIPALLAQAVREGYEGFLTLEPHLVLFDSLQSLEKNDANRVIEFNRAKNGAEGYQMQYDALCGILKQL